MEKSWVHSRDKMLGRNRFLVLLAVGGVTLAIISLSLQFCECTHISCSSYSVVVEQKPACMSPSSQNSLEHSRGPLGALAPPLWSVVVHLLVLWRSLSLKYCGMNLRALLEKHQIMEQENSVRVMENEHMKPLCLLISCSWKPSRVDKVTAVPSSVALLK